MSKERQDRFEALYAAHHDEVLRYAARRAGAGHAADVAAETFTIAWRRIDDVPEGAERQWLYVVARNLTANLGRRDARRRESAESFEDLSAHPVEPDHADAVDRREAALTALRGLSEDDRTMIRLVGWDGLDRVQAAAALGVTPSAATVRLHRARKRLHELFDRPVTRRPGPFQAIAALGMLAAATTLVVVSHRIDLQVMWTQGPTDPIWAALRAQGEEDMRFPPPLGEKVQPLSPALAAGASRRTTPCPGWSSAPQPDGSSITYCEAPLVGTDLPVNFTGELVSEEGIYRGDNALYLFQGWVSRDVARLFAEPKGGGKRLAVPMFATGIPGIREFGLSVTYRSKTVLRAFDSRGHELYNSKNEPGAGDGMPL